MADYWQILYEDGRTFSSSDGRWADAPPLGVQRVTIMRVRPPREGREAQGFARLLHGHGTYYLRVLDNDVWEFGVHADLDSTTTPGVPGGERCIWAPGLPEQVYDQPSLPDWVTDEMAKRATGPPYPWQRGIDG